MFHARGNITATLRAGLHTGTAHIAPPIPGPLTVIYKPERHPMYCLIDCTNYKVIATHKTPGALTALAFIQYANVDTVTMPCDENRPFAQFTSEQLERIYDSAHAFATGAFKCEGYTYNDELHKCRAMIAAAPHLVLPFSEEHMKAEADKIKDDDERPWCIDAAGHAIKAKHWHVAPQRDRPRHLAKPTSPQLTKRTGNGPAVSVAKAAKEAAPAKRVDTLDVQENTKVTTTLLGDVLKDVKAKPADRVTAGRLLLGKKKPAKAAKEAKKPKAKPALPKKVEKEPKYTMTKKAKGLTRAAFLKEGWTDAQLIKHGYMVAK